MCVGLHSKGEDRLSPLIGHNKDHSVPGYCFHPFFPSSLHWPRYLPPALGMWLCHPYLSWSRDEEELPGNTGRQKTSEGQGLESTGPCLGTLQRGPIKARSIPGGEKTANLHQGQASSHLLHSSFLSSLSVSLRDVGPY